MSIKNSVTMIKGIGPKKASALAKVKIHSIEDFLYYYPRDYEDRRQIKAIGSLCNEDTALIRGKIIRLFSSGYGYTKKSILKLLVTDGTGEIEVLFFHSAYLKNTISKNVDYGFYGNVSSRGSGLQMVHPDFFKWDEEETTGILPIYPLTQGLTQGEMRNWQRIAQDFCQQIPEYLPLDLIRRNRLCSLQYALENIHFPEDLQRIKEAKYRLVFDELFLLQFGLLSVKNQLNKLPNGISFSKNIQSEDFIEKLPYELTVAQKRVIEEIYKDMESKKVMSRLIQGDVGSGKTVVAATAIYKAINSGYQAVLMAPTELLARQHYKSLKQAFQPFDIHVGLLTGSLGIKERKQVLTQVKTGAIQLLIGTHALIQPSVDFYRLGLVITDEQHRFGVNQRDLLSRKGENPDILVMTATPIPRTLAVILYGDLDLSIIDEMPPGRKQTITKTFTESGREKAYEFVRRQVADGHQAYIVAPLIEESINVDAKSAIQLYKELGNKFSNLEIRLLHGAMKQEEKDRIMEEFYSGQVHILVSTVVIEVGINVPNATVMLIENAERFGLSTLHQLRGRVGRGGEQSYCILITEGKTRMSKERAAILEKTDNGFVIAEKDLELRGPGEFFGVRQHGIPEFRLADLAKHIQILETVREEAQNLLEQDPDLIHKNHQNLKNKINITFKNIETLSI
ncbi:MAG: ATP-dependent DNA helicase RecG [Eubacteriales bacterium]|nr:ATP-dependent DNA helicase RecG [Eubacteriales bacterium]MDD4582560.1 ATP-dependent DNA helicase RecG [Eubacteriales bacterium]